jgi:hypothetical protein
MSALALADMKSTQPQINKHFKHDACCFCCKNLEIEEYDDENIIVINCNAGRLRRLGCDGMDIKYAIHSEGLNCPVYSPQEYNHMLSSGAIEKIIPENYGALCARLIKNSLYKKGDLVRILNDNCGQPHNWVGKIGRIVEVSTVDLHSTSLSYEVKRKGERGSYFYFEKDLELKNIK